MSAIKTLLIQSRQSIDFKVINKIRQTEPNIEFVAITSDPELILGMFEPCNGNGIEVAVVSKELTISDGTPLYQYIAGKDDHIPLILIDRELEYPLPPQHTDLPDGVFMAIPAKQGEGPLDDLEMEDSLKQSIIGTGNTYRRLRRGASCYDLSNSHQQYSADQERTANFRKCEKSVYWRPMNLKELLAGNKDWPPLSKISRPCLLAIGVSTGGPEALRILFQNLPENFPAPILLVQHINSNFVTSFQDTINRHSQLQVELARHLSICKPSTIYISPEKVHLGIEPSSRPNRIMLKLSDRCNKVNGHIPSAGYLFESIAESSLAPSTVAIIMSGMGEDGSVEIGRIKRAGGITLAQDRFSSSVFGMAKIAIELGNIHREVPLNLLPNLLEHLFRVS